MHLGVIFFLIENISQNKLLLWRCQSFLHLLSSRCCKQLKSLTQNMQLIQFWINETSSFIKKKTVFFCRNNRSHRGDLIKIKIELNFFVLLFPQDSIFSRCMIHLVLNFELIFIRTGIYFEWPLFTDVAEAGQEREREREKKNYKMESTRFVIRRTQWQGQADFLFCHGQ